MIYVVLKTLWSKQWFRYTCTSVISAVLAALATIVVYPSEQIREDATKEARLYAEQEFKETLEQKHLESQESLREMTNKFNEELMKQQHESHQLKQTLSELSKENSNLRSKRRVETVVVKDPSGREETKITDVSESELSTTKEQQKISELQEKFRKEIVETEQRLVLQLTSEKAKYERELSSVKEQLNKTKQKLEISERSSKVVDSTPKRFGLGAGYTTDNKYSAEASYQFWGSLYGQISGDSDLKDHRGRLTLGLRF